MHSPPTPDIPNAPMQNNRKRAARLPDVVEKPIGE
jgi:hypothetical protein